MESAPSFSLALRWLATDTGISDKELAIMAGVSPAAVTRFLTQPNSTIAGWTTLLHAMHCRLEIRVVSRTFSIPLPKISSKKRQVQRSLWVKRHLAANRAQVIRQNPSLTAVEAMELAKRYTDASESRIDDDLAAANDRLGQAHLTQHVGGLRAAVRAIAERSQVNAEDLSLLSGLSLSSVQTIVTGKAEGWLEIPHRLFSALAARIVVLPSAGGDVALTITSPGAWRPEPPRPGVSSLSSETIIERVRKNESLADIGRAAGISRQRVHAIVKKHELFAGK